jgi:low affinity Fe/Cu permease
MGMFMALDGSARAMPVPLCGTALAPEWTVAARESLAEKLSRKATEWAGSSPAFGAALLLIVLWLVAGPVFGYSDTWQLVINTTTTVITFLMVFLIQRNQNRDAQAVHIKLNELLAAALGASNRLIDVESLTEKELQSIHRHFRKLVEMTKREADATKSHSIEEAESRHRAKQKGRKIV